MTCPNCGTANLDNASICANCGRPLTAAAPSAQTSYTPPPPPRPSGFGPTPVVAVPIPNYLVQSILLTICCCQPLAIVAIIFAAQVNSKLAAGDIAGAQAASKNAKLWCWIALGTWLVMVVLSMMFNGLAILQNVRDGSFNQ